MMGDKGESDAVHFVEAEVIAVGPGKRARGDKRLLDDLIIFAEVFAAETDMCIHCNARYGTPHAAECDKQGIATLDPEVIRSGATTVCFMAERAKNQNTRIPPLVKPGDRILYHPAVQRFDREITDLMNNEALNDPTIPQPEAASGSRWFIIREESVLGILE